MIKFNHYFPTPKFLEMFSVAIDISDKSIKFGELVSRSKSLHLKKYGQIKIPDDVIDSGKIKDEKKLTEILKDLRIKENLNFVRVALPEEQMYLFNLSLPNSGYSNLRDLILLQIEEHIPLLADETLFDYDILFETDKNIIVQVVAIPLIEAQKYLSVFENAGLTPISFELEGHAIARSVVLKNNKDTVMVVDFGETRTGVSIVSCGKVLFTTTFDVGGDMLTNMIAKTFSISFEEAEEKKRKYCNKKKGFNEDEDIFPIILNGLSVLRDELNKHFIYWQTHEGDICPRHEPITKIIICGGNANLPELADYISTSMKIKVEVANVWSNIFNINKEIPEMPFEESLIYPTVLGLALGNYVFD